METKSKKEMTPEAENGKLRELFVDQLKDIYWAEKALYKALFQLQEAATSKKLAQAFAKHAQETEGQIAILEQVFERLGEKAAAKKCEAMEGLIKEANEIIDSTEAGTYTRDVGLITAAQKTEHYEIASYGTLVEVAKQMDETEVAQLLQKILDQEKKTDISLTIVAEDKVNKKAAKE